MAKLFFIAVPLFFIVDMIWLGFIARDFYREHLGFLLADHVRWLAAFIFYTLFILGLVVFVISPEARNPSWSRLFLHAALYGLVTYGTYDLTNLATLKGWPVKIVVVDMIWGIALSSSVAGATLWIARKF